MRSSLSATTHVRLHEKEPSKILSHVVNDSLFLQSQDIQDLSNFDMSEIEIGLILGRGEFNTVYEIRRIDLIASPDSISSPDQNQTSTTGTRHGNEYAPELGVDLDENVKMGRTYMSENCLRGGIARYAIKKMSPDLMDDKRLDAMTDLAIESKFLSAINHPNIIKMRAIGGTPGQLDFFLVLDRLHATLTEKLKFWKMENKKKFPWINRSSKKNLQVRLVAAYDIARALRFLNEHNILYRDLKPDNIGFDIRGTVKIFDFGLSKELVLGDKDLEDLYKLTGCTGTIRYMAPEVYLGKPYNLSADVYSFGILLWQILSMEVPFGKITVKEYSQKIVQKGKRPNIKSFGMVNLPHLMKSCWSPIISKRPSMEHVCLVLDKEQSLLGKFHSVDRSSHLFDLSLASRSGEC